MPQNMKLFEHDVSAQKFQISKYFKPMKILPNMQTPKPEMLMLEALSTACLIHTSKITIRSPSTSF